MARGEETTYLARYNRVWENVKTGKAIGNELTLGAGESLTDYRQIPKPAKLPGKVISIGKNIGKGEAMVVHSPDAPPPEINQEKNDEGSKEA